MLLLKGKNVQNAFSNRVNLTFDYMLLNYIGNILFHVVTFF